FVDQVVSEADDDESMDYIMNLENKGKIVRVHFIGDAANEAVISDVAKKFSVTINILQGKLTQTISGVLGTLTIQLQGEKERSEEHTSELQSRFDLVCRLLLEKKKQQRKN